MSIGKAKLSLRVGVLYNPQESRTKKENINKVYQRIEKEIKTVREKKQRVMLMGDFNCKVGEMISGNKPEITMRGKLLLQMLERNGMKLANIGKNCNGLWTRQIGTERSVIDYIILEKKQMEHIHSLLIDEGKNIAPYRKKNEDGIVKTVHSDHNTMLLIIDLLKEDREAAKAQQHKIMNGSRQKFRELMNTTRVSRIWETGLDLQEACNKWNDTVIKIKRKCEVKKGKPKEANKRVRKLRRAKRMIRKLLSEDVYISTADKELFAKRLRLISEYIENDKTEQEKRKVQRVASSIKDENDRINENAFWVYRRRMRGKKCEQKTTLVAHGLYFT